MKSLIIYLVVLSWGLLFGFNVNASPNLDTSTNQNKDYNYYSKDHPNQVGQSLMYEGQFGPDHGKLRSLVFDPEKEGVVYASSYNGRYIFKSIDSGQTWSYLYSIPNGHNSELEISKLSFANPLEPSHLYFLVNDKVVSSSPITGLYVFDVNQVDTLRVIRLLDVCYNNIFDYHVSQSNPNKILVSTYYYNANDATSSSRIVMASSDGGNNFVTIFNNYDFNDCEIKTISFHPYNQELIFLGLSIGILKSSDGGQNWTFIYDDRSVNSLVVVPENNLIYATTGRINEESNIIFSDFNEPDWIVVENHFEPSDSLYSYYINVEVNPQNGDNIWVTHNRAVLYTFDGGENWAISNFDNYDYFYGEGIGIAINPFNTYHVIIPSHRRVIQTVDAGVTWSAIPLYFSDITSFDAINFTNGDKYLYSAITGFYHSTNLETGDTYGNLQFAYGGPEFYITGINNTQSKAYLVEYLGLSTECKIFQSNNHFASTPELVSTIDLVINFDNIISAPDNENIYWFLLREPPFDKLFVTKDGFSTFERLKVASNNESIQVIRANPNKAGEVWAVLNRPHRSEVFKSNDYGVTWSTSSLGLPIEFIWDISINPNNPANLIASLRDREGIYVSFNGGGSWELAFSEFECKDVVFSSQHRNVAFAKRYGQSGLVYTFNAGKDWNLINEELLIDADYEKLAIIDNDYSIDIFLNALGMGISKYSINMPSSYTVTFNINNESGNEVIDAVIIFDNVEHSPGEYIFNNLYPSTFTFEIIKEGYKDYTGEVYIENDDIEVNIILETSETLDTPVIPTFQFSVYPNPTQNYLNISSDVNTMDVEIVNYLGQIVYSKTIYMSHQQLDISNLRSGLYFIKVTTSKGIIVRKFKISK